jgi:hypothetical protein
VVESIGQKVAASTPGTVMGVDPVDLGQLNRRLPEAR